MDAPKKITTPWEIKFDLGKLIFFRYLLCLRYEREEKNTQFLEGHEKQESTLCLKKLLIDKNRR